MRHNITNTTFVQGDILETFTPQFVSQWGTPDLVVLDPPRAGTLISIKKTIISSATPRIIYLSCNHESLATDLRMLCEFYDISHIQPYDMFPHTAQVETLVVLERK